MAQHTELKKHGITADTPKNVILDAGTIHIGLKLTEGAWNFAESLLCATSGGSKFTVTPEVYDIPADGAKVKVKGLTVKQGESATLETNCLEISQKVLEKLLISVSGTPNEYNGYTEIKSKSKIEAGDHFENVAYVGHTIDGREIIIILDNALCTTGLSLEGKDKSESVVPATFECYADMNSDLDVLPWRILFPIEG